MTDERKELIERWAREAQVWPALETARDTSEQHLVDAMNEQLLARWARFAALVRADDDRILRESVPERWKDCASAIGAVQSYIAELEGAVSRARADALEEAAKVCEAMPPPYCRDLEQGDCADAIRKLIQG